MGKKENKGGRVRSVGESIRERRKSGREKERERGSIGKKRVSMARERKEGGWESELGRKRKMKGERISGSGEVK